jgi:hypothetical protein
MYKIGSAGTPVILKLNTISFSQNLSESNLLRVWSNMITTSRKTRLVHMLVDSGASHSFIDPRFVKILGLILRICGSMIVTIANYQSNEMPQRQVYITATMRGIKGNSILING